MRRKDGHGGGGLDGRRGLSLGMANFGEDFRGGGSGLPSFVTAVGWAEKMAFSSCRSWFLGTVGDGFGSTGEALGLEDRTWPPAVGPCNGDGEARRIRLPESLCPSASGGDFTSEADAFPGGLLNSGLSALAFVPGVISNHVGRFGLCVGGGLSEDDVEDEEEREARG